MIGWLTAMRGKLRERLRSTTAEARMDEEIRFHVEMETEKNLRAGMSPAEARRRAVLAFGGVEKHKEVMRAGRRIPLVEDFVRDVGYTVRSLWRSPGFSALAILTLALGIGATTAIYTVVKQVVLDPLPFPEADRLVRLKSQVPGVGAGEEWNMAAVQYFYLRENARSFDAVGAFHAGEVNVQTPEGPQRAGAALVSHEMLALVGARPVLGRSLTAADGAPGTTPVAVLSYGFWQRQFGGDENVLGTTVDVHGIPAEVVGVLADGVELPPEPGAPVRSGADVWLPRGAVDPSFNPAGPFYSSHVIPMVARLAPGVTVADAQAELDRITRDLPRILPEVYSGSFLERYRYRMVAYPLKAYGLGAIAESLWIVLGAVGLVLLIASANVANLLLVRLEGRRREIAIHAALGAGRWAVARRFLAEGLVLAAAGGALAVPLGVWGTAGLVSLAPDTFPRLTEVRADGSVLLFALAVSLAVALALAALPVIRTRLDTPRAVLADGGRGATAGRERGRARSILVGTQVALALVLVTAAGLLLQSFQRLRALDPGFDPSGVLAVELHLSGEQYQDPTTPAWRFHRAVLERVRALPGVREAGMAMALPLSGSYGCTVQGFEDPAVRERLADAEQTTCAAQVPSTPGYFEAMGIPLLRGRALIRADADRPEAAGAVVSRAFAERFWPGEDPIGKGVGANGRWEPPFHRVVGVVGDVHNESLTGDAAAVIYYPPVPLPGANSYGTRDMNLVIRTDLPDPMALLPQVRAAVREVDPTIPVAYAQEVQALVDRSMSRVSFTAMLVAIAGIMALLLAAVGLYGVISYLVARRTGELGLRMALGARAEQVHRLVLGGSLRMAAAGVVVGLAAAFALSRVMRGLLYGVTPTHPLAYLVAVLVLLAVALLASYLPAVRATRIDPMVALRRE